MLAIEIQVEILNALIAVGSAFVIALGTFIIKLIMKLLEK
jgi:hypothetical protein